MPSQATLAYCHAQIREGNLYPKVVKYSNSLFQSFLIPKPRLSEGKSFQNLNCFLTWLKIQSEIFNIKRNISKIFLNYKIMLLNTETWFSDILRRPQKFCPSSTSNLTLLLAMSNKKWMDHTFVAFSENSNFKFYKIYWSLYHHSNFLSL